MTVPRQHPRLDLDEAIHQPVRLSIVAALADAKEADFAFLRDHLQLTDSNLSRHLTALEQAGYVAIRKATERRRPRTWVALTDDGRAAFTRYVGVLRSIVGPDRAP